MLHRASLVVVAAVTRLRRLLSSALSWSPRRVLGFGRRAGGGAAESTSEPHGAGASDADEGYGLERWDAELYRDPLDAPQARLVALGACSQESRQSTQVVFRNGVTNPPARCRLFWLDYQGKLVRYKTLNPGETHRQQTFETHPWTFTTVPARGSPEPRQRLVVDGSPVFFPRRARGADAEAVAEVRRPRLRRWTHDGHKHYPAFFKRVSRAFLLAHARIRREPLAAPPPPRRSRRLLQKRLARAEATVPSDVGPASAEDDANAMFERDEDDRSALDSIGSVPGDAGQAPAPTTLGDLPPELAAHILRLAAPRCSLYRAVEDVVLEANARGAADAEPAIGAAEDEAH